VELRRSCRARTALFGLCLAAATIAVLPTSELVASARATHSHVSPTPPPQAAVLSLSIIPASRAAATVRELFPSAHVRVDPHANAIIVVASGDLLQQIRTVVQGIDVKNPTIPTADVVQLHVVKPALVVPRLRDLYPGAHIEVVSKSSLLVRATPPDMTEIKALITALDVAPPSTAPSSAPAEAVHVNVVSPKTIARAIAHQVPHLRAAVSGSSVILVGTEDDIQKAKALVQQIDAPAFGSRYTQIYRLHNVDATSVGDLVARTYPSVKVTVDKDLNAISVLGTAAQHATISSAIAQLDAAEAAGAGGAPGSGPAYGESNIEVIDLQAAMPGQNGGTSTSATDIASAVTQLLGQMAPDLHVAVPANSSQILLAGSPQSIRLAKQLITRLDQPQPLVVLDTEVLEVDESSARNLGLALPQAILGSTFSEIQPTPNPITFNPGRLIGLQPITRTALQLTLALNLLVQKGNARVLADPRITTISGRTASIRAGDTIAILTQTSGGIGTPVTQQLQTFNTGVTLDITPMVAPNGNVNVSLHPIVNSLEGILNGIPQIATRDTQTVVQLQDNQTLVIGGLIQETMQHSVAKIPLLGDIPLIGKLFQNSNTSTSRNELVIVVTPHILHPGAAPPPPGAALPLPTPQALPTLPPGATLPAPIPTAPPTPPVLNPSSIPPGMNTPLPSPHPEPSPTTVGVYPTLPPTLSTPQPTPSSMPAPTPSAFANTNVFVYGSPPPNTYAADTQPPQIYYVQFSPTILSNNTPVQVFAVTTTNVTKVNVGYGVYLTVLSQIAPSKWQGSFNFNAAGIMPGQAPVNLTLNAYRTDGMAATIQIPVSLATP